MNASIDALRTASQPVEPALFSGLGHSTETVALYAKEQTPVWEERSAHCPACSAGEYASPPRVHGYGLLLTLSREIRGS